MKSYCYDDFAPKKIECSLNGRERTLYNCYLVANNALRANGMGDKADQLEKALGIPEPNKFEMYTGPTSDEDAFKRIEEYVTFGDTGYIEKDWVFIKPDKKPPKDPDYKSGDVPDFYSVEPRDIRSLAIILKAENDASNDYKFARIHPRFREIAKREIIDKWKRAEDETEPDTIISKAEEVVSMDRLFNAIRAKRRSKMEWWAIEHIICERIGRDPIHAKTPEYINAEEKKGLYEQIYSEQERLYDSTFNKKTEVKTWISQTGQWTN